MKLRLCISCGLIWLGLVSCNPHPTPDPNCSDSTSGVDCPSPPFCGGIAGFACPGFGVCIDNPNDSCDPAHGGADCGGLCSCDAYQVCKPGYRFDAKANVCDCVRVEADPCAVVRCMSGTHCEATAGVASCVADFNPCTAALCPVGTICVAQGSEPACLPAVGETCGSVSCPIGTKCCNRSCGICVPPGGACIQMMCE